MAEAKEKKVVKKRRRARVVLRGARTYQLAGRRFIKDVPQLVVGDDLVETFMLNGYFHVTELEPQVAKKKKKKKSSSDDEGDAKGKGKVTLQK